MTATYWLGLFFAMSALLLVVPFTSARQVAGFLSRQYKTAAALLCLLLPTIASAQGHAGGGEANLTLPDLKSVSFSNFFGLNGHALLSIGLLFCVGGLLFGLAIYVQLKNLPVHRSMREIS